MESLSPIGENQGIRFFYESKELDSIQPSASVIPYWYRKVPLTLAQPDGTVKPSVKNCFPFAEALNIGYLLLTTEDYVFSQESNGMRVTSSTKDVFLGRPPKQSVVENPIPEGYLRSAMSWSNPVSIEIPEGYSCLFTHPMNRFDIPFFTFSAVVDGYYKMPPGDIAFVIRADFEGVIPAGTPYAQVIPFQRQDFVFEENKGLLQRTEEHFAEIVSRSKDYGEEWRNQKKEYTRNSWKKKSYKIQ